MAYLYIAHGDILDHVQLLMAIQQIMAPLKELQHQRNNIKDKLDKLRIIHFCFLKEVILQCCFYHELLSKLEQLVSIELCCSIITYSCWVFSRDEVMLCEEFFCLERYYLLSLGEWEWWNWFALVLLLSLLLTLIDSIPQEEVRKKVILINRYRLPQVEWP
jgi:hypothetical protein